MFCPATSPGQIQMKKQPSNSFAGNEMTVASHSISAKTVKTSQPGGVNTTMIATVRYYCSSGADSFHCCLLWSSKHTENCISFQPLRQKPKPHQGLPATKQCLWATASAHFMILCNLFVQTQLLSFSSSRRATKAVVTQKTLCIAAFSRGSGYIPP